jgi:hypothetical protein
MSTCRSVDAPRRLPSEDYSTDPRGRIIGGVGLKADSQNRSRGRKTATIRAWCLVGGATTSAAPWRSDFVRVGLRISRVMATPFHRKCHPFHGNWPPPRRARQQRGGSYPALVRCEQTCGRDVFFADASQAWLEQVDLVERLVSLGGVLSRARATPTKQRRRSEGRGAVDARVAERVARLVDDARVRAYELLGDRPKALAIMERRLLAD